MYLYIEKCKEILNNSFFDFFRFSSDTLIISSAAFYENAPLRPNGAVTLFHRIIFEIGQLVKRQDIFGSVSLFQHIRISVCLGQLTEIVDDKFTAPC